MSLQLLITLAREGSRGILPAQHINLPLPKVSLPGIRKYTPTARKGKSKPENTGTVPFHQHRLAASL